MNIEPQPYDQSSDGGTPRRSWRVPRFAIGVGITAFLGLAGAGLAFAVGSGGGTPGASLSSSSASSSTSTTLPKAAHPHGPGMHARFGMGRAGEGVVHGQYTMHNGTSYRTVAVQVGQVTAVSPTSITVQSTDGFTQTYVVETATVVDSQAGDISTVAVKDQVELRALVNGKTQTATDIVDVTKVGDSHKGFGYGRHGPVPPAGGDPRGPSAPA